MIIEKDNNENNYFEVDMDNGEKVRVTHIAKSRPGRGGLRIQARDENGHLRTGIEIPVDKFGDVVSSINNLMQ